MSENLNQMNQAAVGQYYTADNQPVPAIQPYYGQVPGPYPPQPVYAYPPQYPPNFQPPVVAPNVIPGGTPFTPPAQPQHIPKQDSSCVAIALTVFGFFFVFPLFIAWALYGTKSARQRYTPLTCLWGQIACGFSITYIIVGIACFILEMILLLSDEFDQYP